MGGCFWQTARFFLKISKKRLCCCILYYSWHYDAVTVREAQLPATGER